jgi:tol-pal system protein YbgF
VQTPPLEQSATTDGDVPISAILDGEPGVVDSVDEVGNPITPASADSQLAGPADAGSGLEATNALSTEAGSAEQLAYQQAFDFLKKGQYDKAIEGFNEYLARYPQENNADNAQYWLGETHYVKRKFSDAQQAFGTLLERYPNTPKRADATLKIGFAHYELGQWGDARRVLDEVKVNYPGTAAAQLAEIRLQKMIKEGH